MLFAPDGRPYKFFIDKGPDISFSDRGAILKDIRTHGGETDGRWEKADIILVADGTPPAQTHSGNCQTLAASGGQKIVVLDLGWITQCIRENVLFNTGDWGGCTINPPDADGDTLRPNRNDVLSKAGLPDPPPIAIGSSHFTSAFGAQQRRAATCAPGVSSGSSSRQSNPEPREISAGPSALSRLTSESPRKATGPLLGFGVGAPDYWERQLLGQPTGLPAPRSMIFREVIFGDYGPMKLHVTKIVPNRERYIAQISEYGGKHVESINECRYAFVCDEAHGPILFVSPPEKFLRISWITHSIQAARLLPPADYSLPAARGAETTRSFQPTTSSASTAVPSASSSSRQSVPLDRMRQRLATKHPSPVGRGVSKPAKSHKATVIGPPTPSKQVVSSIVPSFEYDDSDFYNVAKHILKNPDKMLGSKKMWTEYAQSSDGHGKSADAWIGFVQRNKAAIMKYVGEKKKKQTRPGTSQPKVEEEEMEL